MREAILAYFARNSDKTVSGGEMSRELGISRTAVWKHIQTLKKQGYRFDSAPNKGYRLIGVPDQLAAEAIRQAAGDVSILT